MQQGCDILKTRTEGVMVFKNIYNLQGHEYEAIFEENVRNTNVLRIAEASAEQSVLHQNINNL